MVMRCLLVSKYKCVRSFCIIMMCVFVLMSFSGLHSVMEIYVSGMIIGGGMNRVSRDCL